MTYRFIGTLCAASVLVAFAPASAQEAVSQDQVDALERQVAALQARTDLSQAELDRANVLLDQLPSYDGTVDADAATGKFEATILSANALGFLAEQFAGQAPKGNTLVLAGNESFAFGAPFGLGVEMVALHRRIVDPMVCGDDCKVPDVTNLEFIGAPAFAAAISTVAGLLRSDVKLTSLDTPAVDSAMLATAVAASINTAIANPAEGRSADVLAGSPGSRVSLALDELDDFNETAAWYEGSDIGRKFAWVVLARRSAQLKLDQLSGDEDLAKKNKDQIARLKQWNKDFDDFYARVTKASDTAPAPIASAIQVDQLETTVGSILRVDVELAGGTLKKTQNIATFFGLDPLRVTGGVVATYALYQPMGDGRFTPTRWGLWACASNAMRLHEVRATEDFSRLGTADAVNTCRSVATFPHAVVP